ncbi:MAG: hypothetical protein FJW40_01885 [Acidobacteria bacterium]|nr:hypothetical protein [Acidobacteriota bacterium]
MSTPPLIAIVDSGIHPGHPHVGEIEAAETFTGGTWLDGIGHGTAVAGLIEEWSPGSRLLIAKVFDRQLVTSIDTLERALHWCFARGARFINLSLGTSNPEHRPRFEALLAAASGPVFAPAMTPAGPPLPAGLPGVIAVDVDWACPTTTFRHEMRGGAPVFLTSGYAREIPGVPPERNLRGISFAVARMTGIAARYCHSEAAARAFPSSLISLNSTLPK